MIPKSQWIENFLLKWDFFNSREKIIFLNKLNSKFRIKEIIAEARKSFISNDFQATMAKCYIALEAIPKELGYKDIKNMFNILTTESSNKNKYIKINEIFKTTKDFMHLARHDQEVENYAEYIKISKNDAN